MARLSYKGRKQLPASSFAPSEKSQVRSAVKAKYGFGAKRKKK